MRVSVIIPLYNKEPYVRRALSSIAAQTFDDYEIVVVDDGSHDAGVSVVQSFAQESGARLRLFKQTNAGPGAARNRGIEEARGELVAFLDADDEWLPGYLEECVRLLEEGGREAAAVTCGYYLHPPGESREPMWRARGLREGMVRVAPDTPPTLFVSMLAYMSPCTTVARREVVRRWGGFYARDRCLYAEDAHLWMKVLLNEKVRFSLKPLARFHAEASDLSNNLKGARPVEPFLEDPTDVAAACPERLRPLLGRVLAARAFKTACVLGYWGDWQAARSLVRRHAVAGGWRLPYYLPSLVCRTPLGAALGHAWRAFT